MAGRGVNGNLIPGDQRSPENNRKNGRKGGLASGEAKKRKKQTRELVKMVLEMQVNPPAETKHQLKKKLNYDVAEQGPPPVELLMLMQLASQAMAGDLAAAKFLYDYAQIPDLKAQMEKDRMEAAKEGTAEKSPVTIIWGR